MLSRDERQKLHGQDYVEKYEHLPTHARLGRLLEYIDLNTQQCVIDLACGNGAMMEYVAPYVARYVGVDFSEPFIAVARHRAEEQRFTNVYFECVDIVEFCQRNPRQFDIGFAMDVSEHIYDDEWLDILKGVRFALKPGGRLYLHTPNAEFFLERMKARNLIMKQFVEHIALRTPQENIDLLQQAGFSHIDVRLIPHYNLLKHLHPLSHIPLIGKYLKARIFIEAS